jgi:hypothetical protein
MATLKEQIESAQEKWLQDKIFRSRWKSLRASGIGDVCNRRLYYYLTCGELADEISTDLVAIFEEGKEQEPAVRRYLSELGFEINKSGFTENMASHGISGQVDGTMQIDGTRYIVEIKTVSESAWESLNEPKDFNDGYYRKWYAQMQVYLLLFNYEKGVFILKRKQAKQVKIIEMNLDYEYAEGLLKKAEIVNSAIKSNVPPDFLGQPIECKKCPFFSKVCNPPLDFGETVMNLDDEELEEKLERRDELIPAQKEYAALDKEVKELKEHFPNLREAFCGDFQIVIKEQNTTGYEYPEDIKQKYAITKTIKKVDIKRIGVKEA